MAAPGVLHELVLAQELGAFLCGHCDVSDASTIDACFAALEEKWGKIDFLVHAISLLSPSTELIYQRFEPSNRPVTPRLSLYRVCKCMLKFIDTQLRLP